MICGLIPVTDFGEVTSQGTGGGFQSFWLVEDDCICDLGTKDSSSSSAMSEGDSRTFRAGS